MILAMTVDATNLYAIAAGQSFGNSGVVGYVPLAGGTFHNLTTMSGSEPYAIAVDATDVYWVDNAGYSPSVHRIPIAGGPITDIGYATAFPGRTVAVDDANVYWTDQGSLYAHPKATAGTDLDGGGGDLSGQTTMIASGADGSLGALGGDVYFTGQLGLQRIPRGGGQAEMLAGSNGDAIAIDGTNVYFTEITGGVNRYQTSDGTSHAIGNVPSRAGGAIAVDATYVYEYLPLDSDPGTSGIVKWPK
jgi:hypothetical protein